MARIKQKMESPFSDWPQMKFLEREQALHITGKYTAPSFWWSKAFPILVLLLAVPLFPAACLNYLDSQYGGYDNAPDSALWGFPLAYGVVVFAFLATAEHFGRRRKLNIKFSPEAIEIKGKRYPRTFPYQFAIEEHEKAFREEQIERERGKGVGRFFRDAMQVVMRYGDRRVAIGAFQRTDVRKAEALLLRLQLLDKALEDMLGTAAQADAEAPGGRNDFGPARPIR